MLIKVIEKDIVFGYKASVDLMCVMEMARKY